MKKRKFYEKSLTPKQSYSQKRKSKQRLSSSREYINKLTLDTIVIIFSELEDKPFVMVWM